MAAIPSDIEIDSAPRNTRVNEIIAIGLIAIALLLALCLASYHPNDASWNAAGESGARNWIGAVGANVSAALFQGIGLAAYLLPLLILAAAWRRFRSLKINAPLSRLAGLLIIVLSSSALLSLANLRPFYDNSFNAGGLTGAVISRALVAAEHYWRDDSLDCGRGDRNPAGDQLLVRQLLEILRSQWVAGLGRSEGCLKVSRLAASPRRTVSSSVSCGSLKSFCRRGSESFQLGPGNPGGNSQSWAGNERGRIGRSFCFIHRRNQCATENDVGRRGRRYCAGAESHARASH
jgi:hypothetical protein